MSRSAEQAEHEVEQSRERLDRTLDDLQARVNVSGVREQLSSFDWRSTIADGGVQQLLSAVRRDPVPALMICAGLAWIVYETVNRPLQAKRFISAGRQQSAVSPADEHAAVSESDRLDKALEESFPGSDPVSVQITK